MMKTIRFVSLLLIITTTYSCLNDDCTVQEVPPGQFVFNMYDNATMRNIFSDDAYETTDLQVVDMIKGTNVTFSTVLHNGDTYIVISGFGAISETIRLQFTLKNQEVFRYSVDAERVTTDCYRLTDYKNHNFAGAQYEEEKSTGAIRLLLNL